MAGLEYIRGNGERFMNEGSSELAVQLLPDAQRNAIVGIADIRRQTQFLGTRLDGVIKNPSYSEVAEPLRATYDDQYRLVAQVMQGAPIDLAGTENIESHMVAALQYQDVAPQLAALHFAKAAALKQAGGVDYREALDKAKVSLDTSEKMGHPRTTPADFLPDAYILGIGKRAADGVEMPTPEAMAEAIQADPTLLKDYALVLDESQRDEFVAAFPENRRAAISLELDRAVSEVLNKRYLTDPEEIEQHDSVKTRVQEAFTQSLQAFAPLQSHESTATYEPDPKSPWNSKKITETIANLGEEDSLRLLRDLAQSTTSRLKEVNKKFKRMAPGEKSEALRPALYFTARVLDTLIDADVRRGGTLTMRYLEMTALPDRFFTYFTKKLIDQEYFTKSLSPFLTRAENIPVIKKIMSKYGPQFNTIIDTVSQTPDYSTEYNLVPYEAELFDALSDLNTLTPRIFSRYRSLPKEDRGDFAERIKTLKPQFFRNTPIKRVLSESDRDILTEMVYMTYKPMGMSFDQVEKLIGRVDDHTDDLSAYVFPDEGYPLQLEKSGRYVMKEQQVADLASLRRYRNLLVSPIAPDGKEDQLTLSQAVNNFLQADNQTGDASQLGRISDDNLRVLFQPFQALPHIQEFLERHPDVSSDNAFQAEGELAEIMGIYFRDNYTSSLTEYLNSNPDELQQILTTLNDEGIRSAITERLQQFNGEFNWDEFDNATQSPKQNVIRRFLAPNRTPSPQALVASLLTQLVEKEQVEPIQKHIQSELSKFTVKNADGSSYGGELKAYISKNVGSFFAKAAAGICTAEDIPLFERDDHFHINVVENDELVRANIQAYIARVDGKPSLILRGFNPTPDWLGKIDIDNFCDQILALGRQFQRDNGLGGVYITEQSGGWHALSNREQVARYMTKKYMDGKAAVNFPLQVSSSHKIQTIYRV